LQSNTEIKREYKALKVVVNFGVKKHIFLPSRRTIWTVVGREGDFLIDLDEKGMDKDYCSCSDFHFRVLSGTVAQCYHLIAARKAIETGRVSVIESPDDDYKLYLKLLLGDVFAHMS